MPAVARVGDREIVHCSMPKRKGHFGSVYANGKQMSGVGHLNTLHLKPCPCPKCCCFHQVPLKSGSPNVFANGGGPSSTSLYGSSSTSIAREESIYDMGST